jgi:glycosyltransferase involved in cell wall biosynthesis
VVHTHNSAPQIAAGLGQQLRRWRAPGTALVHTEHGRLGDVRPALLRWRRWTVTAFDAVFAVSADAREQLLAHGIQGTDGVDVVRNGIDLRRFPLRDASRQDGTRAVHVGRLDHIKGQDVLIAAMPSVQREVPAAHLTIVGDGPTRLALEEQAQRLGVAAIVTFVGATDDVRPHLQSADLFVLPSRSEGISIALLEAMATGLAIVATDVGGNREVITSDAVGTLVGADQPAELASAISAMLRDPVVGRAAGVAARQVVDLQFSSETTARTYADHYARVQAARREHAIRSAA